MDDVLIIGGGVIGLSTAWELARQGARVHLIDRREPGKEASWAGAGMIPPGDIHFENRPYREMSRQSALLWPDVSAELFQATGLDNEYRRCGAVILAEPDVAPEVFQSEMARWTQQGVTATPLDADDCSRLEPALRPASALAYALPQQAQVRNPRHLAALLAACLQLGVRCTRGVTLHSVDADAQGIRHLRTSEGTLAAGQFLWATGAWTQSLRDLLQWNFPVEPVRGQIVLLRTPGFLRGIVEQGKRYLVPRADGRLLIGSTEERVGFNREENEELLQQLLDFGKSLVPELEHVSPERHWCGFRPATQDLLPILGRFPHWKNAWMATGHYRAGLSLSPLTGRIMRQLLLDQPPDLDISPFSPERFLLPVDDAPHTESPA